MLNLLFILLFTISHTISLNSMEPQKKSSKEKGMVKKKSKSLLSLSRKSSNEKNEEKSTIINTPLEDPFIIATRMAIESEDYTTVKFYLRNPYLDPNITDQQGYSPLQLFIKQKAYDGIKLLLTDHRVHFRYEDLYKKEISQEKEDTNQQPKTIIEYIDKKNNRELYHNIFARFTLDLITTQQCNNMKPFYEHSFMTDTALIAIIQKIKTKIENDALKQPEQQEENEENDSNKPALPKSACLPDYATDEFIEKKIWFILSSPQH